MKNIEFLKVDLQMFDDGEASTPTNTMGSETTVSTPQTMPTSSRTQQRNPLADVVYSKEESPASVTADKSTPDTQGKEKEVDRKALWLQTKEQFKDMYGEDVAGIVKDRLKKHSAVEQRLGQVDPIISMLLEKYQAKDEAHLMQLVQEDTIEAYADKEGFTLEQARETYKIRNENKALQKQINEFATKDQEIVINQQIAKWRGEETEIQKEIPEFNLDSFSENKQFMDLLAAGIEMKVIYQVLNLDSIIQKNVQQAQKNTATNIQARGNKIPEAGAKKTAGIIMRTDVNTHTREDRAEINRRVKMGEIIKL